MPSTQKFISLYSVTQPILERFIASHIPDVHKVKDLLQDVSIILWNKFDQYEEGTSFKSWAMKVAYYEVLHSKRDYVKNNFNVSLELLTKITDYYDNLHFEELTKKQLALEHCMGKMEGQQHKLLKLRYWSKEPYFKISKIMNRKEDALRTQVRRIKESLKTCIRKYYNDEYLSD